MCHRSGGSAVTLVKGPARPIYESQVLVLILKKLCSHLIYKQKKKLEERMDNDFITATNLKLMGLNKWMRFHFLHESNSN